MGGWPVLGCGALLAVLGWTALQQAFNVFVSLSSSLLMLVFVFFMAPFRSSLLPVLCFLLLAKDPWNQQAS